MLEWNYGVISFHEVSLQLMRRFTELHSLGVELWPRVFRQYFAPLLEGQKYNKGSLAHMKVHCESDSRTQSLPPVLECAFESLLLESLKQTIIKAKIICHDHFMV